MNTRGHNENAVRLSMLADDAKTGLDRVESGEAEAVKGWLAYGAALNEGRSLFPSDEQFGQWLVSSNLEVTHPADRSAAMWAAANADQLSEAQAASKARTLRGWHDQWKKIAAEREKAATEAEAKAERDRLAAEAKEAKRLADEKAKAERAAQAAVAKAQTDEDREKAEAKAEEAATEKAEAAKAAAQAEAAVKQAAPKPEDPDAKARKELSKLTTEALIDEVIGLRADLAEAKAKAKKRGDEIEKLKAQIAVFKQDNMGRSLGNAMRQAETAEGRIKEYQAIAKRADTRAKALEAENKKLRAEIENTIIPMGQ